MSTAAAPSLMPHEFAAVTVPSLRKMGRKRASRSMLKPDRGRSSRSLPLMGRISAVNSPASCAARARRWESTA